MGLFLALRLSPHTSDKVVRWLFSGGPTLRKEKNDCIEASGATAIISRSRGRSYTLRMKVLAMKTNRTTIQYKEAMATAEGTHATLNHSINLLHAVAFPGLSSRHIDVPSTE